MDAEKINEAIAAAIGTEDPVVKENNTEDDSTHREKNTIEKKKPGRPKKHPQMPPIETHGIVQKPVNEGDFLEMVYVNPSLFKKIFAMFKSFRVGEVDMTFDQAGLRMSSKDFLKKSNIYTIIDGRCMNLYYCKETIKIRIKRDNMEKILSSLGKNHHKITFVLKDNYRSKLYVNIKDSEYGATETYEIEIIRGAENGDIANNDDDTNYPVRFHFSARHLKTRINNLNKLTKNFTIQKIGDSALQLTYDRGHSVNLNASYGENEKIGLVSRLAEGECLSVSICIDYIKPFTNSTIGDEVFIAVDKREKISFMTQMDKCDFGWAATVKIFTEINKLRAREPDKIDQ